MVWFRCCHLKSDIMYTTMLCFANCPSVIFLRSKGSGFTVIHNIPWGLLLQLAKLLIIGGVEVNPGPSNESMCCCCCCFYWCCESTIDDDDERLPLLSPAAPVYSIQQVNPPPQVITHVNFTPPQRLHHNNYQNSAFVDRTRATSDSSYSSGQYESQISCCSSSDSLLPATENQHQTAGQYKSLAHSNPRGPKFKKVPGFAEMAGQLFEVKMAALLFIRGVNQSLKFYLASNMEGGGSTDDIVFISGQKAIFLQLKHRKDPNKKITDTQLLQLTGDFSLFKYYKSYHKMKQQWTEHKDLRRCGRFENSVFVIYSNASMNCKGINTCTKQWHSIVDTGGLSFRITEQSHPHVYEMFDAVIKYKSQLPMEATVENAAPLITNLGKKVWNVSGEREIELIFKELNKIEDLSYYKEFLKQLWLYTGQAGEQDFDGVIQEEITKAFGVSESEKQNIYSTFLAEISDWWKSSNRFLTESAELWEKIYLSRIESVSMQTLKDIQRLNVCFNSEINSLTPFLSKNARFLNIVTDGTKGSFALCSLKVHQSLSGKCHMILHRSALQERRTEVFALWERWCDTLIIIHDGRVTLDFLPYYPNKSLIYISNFPIHDADLVIYETITLNHLDLKSKTQILSTVVHFQGYDVPLGEITGTSIDILNFISADIIVRILLGEKIIIGSDLPRQIDYFIPRILECQHSLRAEILCPETSEFVQKPNSSDRSPSVVFAISGLTSIEFELLMPSNRNVTKFQEWNSSYKCKNADKCLFVIINGEDDFHKLAQCYRNAHWIHGEKYIFHWKQSRGDTAIIRNNLHSETSLVNIETILDLPQKVVLLSAEAGMGKTTLVDHLVRKAKEIDPKRLIFNINLNETINELEALPENMEFRDISNFLLEISGFERDFRQLFERKLVSMKDVSIVLDGFDEVSSMHSNKVILMMKHLLLTKVDKLWITTRCSSRKQLEVSLSTLCYTLLPLSEKDQQNLIMELWKTDFPHIEEPLLAETCNNLLQWLTLNLSDKSEQFVAVPLQAMLLAHAYKDELARCIEAGIIVTPKTLNLLQLFRNFIDRKFSIFYERYKVNERQSGVSLMTSAFKEYCFQQHTCLALMTLFSPEEIHSLPDSNNVMQTVKKSTDLFVEGCDYLGIVKDVVHGNPVFIHRTFAEFFAAEWFSTNYKHLNDNMREKLLDPLFQVTRHFFNRILAEKSNMHIAVLNDDKHEVERLIKKGNVVNIRDLGGRTALHLAVMNSNAVEEEGIDFTNSSEIIKALLSHGADPCLEDDVLKWRPLKIAGTIKAWTAMNLLLQHGADTKDLAYIGKQISNIEHVKLFKIISKHGFVELLRFLMHYGISLKQYFNVTYPTGENSVTLLHEAIRHKQLRLVEFLLQNYIEIDARDSLDRRTPLILAAVHGEQDIIKLLISRGASPELRDKNGYTAALLTSQHEKNKTERICDNNILQWAAVSGDVDMVKNLLESIFHINCINPKMQTALWCAAWGGKLPVVQFLLKRGADLHIQDTEWGWSPLHVAAKWGYLQIVENLVEHGASLALRDNQDLTPLDVALQKGHITVAKYILNTSVR